MEGETAAATRMLLTLRLAHEAQKPAQKTQHRASQAAVEYKQLYAEECQRYGPFVWMP